MSRSVRELRQRRARIAAPEAGVQFPVLTSRAFFRVVRLWEERGALPPRVARLAGWLTQQCICPQTGRVLGPKDQPDVVETGMELAGRYAAQFGRTCRDKRSKVFWEDFKALRDFGLAVQIVSPAPGRHAVYALALADRAIPSGLPEDLARQLQVWDVPDAPDTHEDARRGRLTEAQLPALAEAQVRTLTAQEAGTLAAAPRWAHPAGSGAAAAAEAIRDSSMRLTDELFARALAHEREVTFGAPISEKRREELLEQAGRDARIDLRATAVAEPEEPAAVALLTRRQALSTWLGEYNNSSDPETSPYTREGEKLSGVGCRKGPYGADLGDEIEEPKTKTAPSATTGKGLPPVGGDVRAQVARRVLKRAWHHWRHDLGRSRVILRSDPGSGPPGSPGTSQAKWLDLERTITIALRRATEAQVLDLLTANMRGVDDVATVAGWRLWRLINSPVHRDAHQYRQMPKRALQQAAHVTRWDFATEAERKAMRIRGQAGPTGHNPALFELRQAQAAALERAAVEAGQQRLAAEERERKRKEADYRRWGIQVPPARENELVHLSNLSIQAREDLAALQAQQRRVAAAPLDVAAVQAAALTRARAEKRARRRGELDDEGRV